MSVQRWVTVVCDGCADQFGTHNGITTNRFGTARKFAARSGWARTADGADLCPRCLPINIRLGNPNRKA